MTKIFLTDRDYKIINSGDTDEIKRLVNDLRTETVQQKITINTLTSDCRQGLEMVKTGKQCQRK
jgi:DNA polymerase III delta subunit